MQRLQGAEVGDQCGQLWACSDRTGSSNDGGEGEHAQSQRRQVAAAPVAIKHGDALGQGVGTVERGDGVARRGGVGGDEEGTA